MLYLNSDELLIIVIEEIEAAVDSPIEDSDIVNRVKGLVGFVHRMRDKKEAEKV